MYHMAVMLFFLFKQKTAYEMRISDWSSDVCSSDLSIYAEDYPAMSEDCLTLNVGTPEHAKAAPVFVWIHGGSLVTGSGSEAMYDGAKLAKEGMIVVTINYRLGVHGYLAHPGLSAESPDHVSGNYWLVDQIEAVKWATAPSGLIGGALHNITTNA